MTNPIFEHLPPGPQRDEAEAESQMATARATIARFERALLEARAVSAAHEARANGLEGALTVATKLLERCVKYAREDRMKTPGSTRLARVLAEAERVLERGAGR